MGDARTGCGDADAAELAFSAGLEGLARGERAQACEGLMDLAALRGDDAAEALWARRGADVGSSRCLVRHGHLLAVAAGDDPAALRHALGVVERGLTTVDGDGFFVAALVALAAGERDRARLWLTSARGCGHGRAGAVLDALGA